MDLDPTLDLAVFVLDLQDAKKKNLSFSDYYFFNVHLHLFSNIKSHREVTKQGSSYYFSIFA